MPIIKDKYGAKGDSPRSRYEKLSTTTPVDTSKLNTGQKQEVAANIARLELGTNISRINPTDSVSVSSQDTVRPRSIEGFKPPVANTVEVAFTLEANQNIEDILISHHHSSGTSAVVGLYWSVTPKADLAITLAGNGLTAIPRQSLFRILTESFPSGSSICLRGYGAESFSNIDKVIYFYVVCSVVGPTITVIKS
tara:strand:+ start:228 stop:812 length:585 start_codon:yes stop_codon:yes gene_type:complete